ncbi:MAG TPA: rhomboid family intramembrane serine protease [Candidatus Acidoferrales bacterium]|nr:rhomboid family intramembrane serine protease [Candidatus Acidoferrales bacterium]
MKSTVDGAQSTVELPNEHTSPHALHIVAVTADLQQALDWELALLASGVHSHRRAEGVGWQVLVHEAEIEQAYAVLEAYRQDGIPSPASNVVLLEYGPTYVAFVVAVTLVAFYAWLALYDRNEMWFWRGNASAEKILRGEVWRTVTALTLHADAVHIVSNALFFALFGSALFRAIGPGLGLSLLLLSGAIGNGLDALWRGPPNIAVGASTAIFGGVGILGGLRFMNRYRIAASRRRAWVALAATLGLLAMLGTAPGTDVLAHFFGAVVGVVLGIIVAVRLQRPPGVMTQLVLGAAGIAAVCVCWAIALVR